MNSKHLVDLGKVIPGAECYIKYQDKVLMFKRSETSKRFPGYWIGPGGHIDATEDALTAAIREAEEETGVKVGQSEIKLKALAIHHHLDSKETWMLPIFLTTIPENQKLIDEHDEGGAKWIPVSELLQMENVFPPAKFYFDHVLRDKPGIMYTNIYWENSQLVEVKSQRIDRDY